tara:strand:- start:153 stop:416 length:264 start_codon:yes stop_codon:yes gene_type:complete
MAITKTTTLGLIEVRPLRNQFEFSVVLNYTDSIDDPDDADLPVTNTRQILLSQKINTKQEDGSYVESDTDISSYEAIVQSICNLVWA